MRETNLKLNPQAERILATLRSGLWRCSIDWGYADGHGKRLTDISRYVAQEGLKLEWAWCDCGRHTAKIKKRRLVPIQESPLVKEFREMSRPKVIELSEMGRLF